MKRFVLTIIAAAVAAPAFAANAYVGASVGRAEQKVSTDGGSLAASDTGAKLVGGYQITPAVGVEAGFALLGKSEVSAGGYSASAEPKSIYLAVTGTVPVTPAMSAFAKIGAAHTQTIGRASYPGDFQPMKSEENQASVLLGIGVSFAISKQVSIVVEYEHFGEIVKEDGGSLKADLLTAGVRFNF